MASLTFIDSGTDLDTLLPLAPVGRTPWADLDAEDRAAFVERCRDFIGRLRKAHRAFYGSSWREDLAYSDEIHAETAYEYGRLALGCTYEHLMAKPWHGVNCALAHMG